MRLNIILGVFLLIAGAALFTLNNQSLAVDGVLDTQGEDLMMKKPENYPVATFAGGCFWCVESEFRVLNGVLFTRAGYMGGNLENPNYEDITTGKTGHAEAVEVTFDPEKISYDMLVEFFMTKAHDPTQLNRQGVDVGTQYRSEIFYHDGRQRETAQGWIDRLKESGVAVVTRLEPAGIFWEAETYHQQYYEKYEKSQGQIHPRVYFKRQAKSYQ